MIKIKEYQDAEFEITGISEGLRDEDMCFTCVTEDGIEFKAKPMGSRELKQEYRDWTISMTLSERWLLLSSSIIQKKELHCSQY